MEPQGETSTKLEVRKEDATAEDDELGKVLADIGFDTDPSRETLFRDPSGRFFNAEHWIPSKKYWGAVRRQVWNALQGDESST